MLKQRIITALALVVLLMPALIAATAWPFALLTLLLMATAGWEWGRLNGAGATGSVVLGGSVAALGLAAFALGWTVRAPIGVWWVAGVAWVIGSAIVLRGGPPAWPRLAASGRWAFGLAMLWVVWLGLVNAKAIGVNFILSVLCLVWAADICAYFGGRAFGRRKLAPAISPGKSWEGVWSGTLGALALAAGWLWLDASLAVDSASLYGRLAIRFGHVVLAAMVVFLVAMSVVGDLFESLVKRSAGAKDSSALLPGHGGVLDRVDALLPVFPIALALASVT